AAAAAIACGEADDRRAQRFDRRDDGVRVRIELDAVGDEDRLDHAAIRAMPAPAAAGAASAGLTTSSHVAGVCASALPAAASSRLSHPVGVARMTRPGCQSVGGSTFTDTYDSPPSTLMTARCTSARTISARAC